MCLVKEGIYNGAVLYVQWAEVLVIIERYKAYGAGNSWRGGDTSSWIQTILLQISPYHRRLAYLLS